jgi:hypothetical protein
LGIPFLLADIRRPQERCSVGYSLRTSHSIAREQGARRTDDLKSLTDFAALYHFVELSSLKNLPIKPLSSGGSHGKLSKVLIEGSRSFLFSWASLVFHLFMEEKILQADDSKIEKGYHFMKNQ